MTTKAKLKEEQVVRIRGLTTKPKIKNMGFWYISPWFIAFLIFGIFPIGLSFYMSFMEWSVVGVPKFIGFKNYTALFRDAQFLNSLYVTVRYAFYSVPLGMVTAFSIAFILNTKTRGVGFYRTLYYLPAVVSGVAIGIIWRWVLDPVNGLLNSALAVIGITGPGWLTDPAWVLPSYLMIAIWGAGAGMLTYLVALNEVSKDLYEAAEIQGAGFWHKLFFITLPLMRPILYFNLIMGIIGSFKKFTDAYILGGAGNQAEFVMLYLYKNAFAYFKMGYASAMSWLLLVIILLITLLIFKFTDFWKYSQMNGEQ
ncbi:MAG: carbohydrate ABC transporter permease [Culicoidibacterales bacterium]